MQILIFITALVLKKSLQNFDTLQYCFSYSSTFSTFLVNFTYTLCILFIFCRYRIRVVVIVWHTKNSYKIYVSTRAKCKQKANTFHLCSSGVHCCFALAAKRFNSIECVSICYYHAIEFSLIFSNFFN